MRVGELKKLLESVPDTAEVLVPGNDHSLRPASAADTTALYSTEHNHWWQDFGERLARGEQRLKVVVIE